VKGIAFMEAIVRPVTWDEWPEQARQMFQAFRTPGTGEQMIMEQNMFVEAVLPGAILRKLSPEEMDRYREPYPTPASRKPLWRWPNEIPIDGQPPNVRDAVQAYSEWLGRSQTPKLLLYAQPGAILRNLVGWCRQSIANLKQSKSARAPTACKRTTLTASARQSPPGCATNRGARPAMEAK